MYTVLKKSGLFLFYDKWPMLDRFERDSSAAVNETVPKNASRN